MKLLWGLAVAVLCAHLSSSQNLVSRPSAEGMLPSQAVVGASTITLVVPTGTPLKIAIEKEIRVRKIGQPLEGRVVEPIYAFDKLVIPAGTEAIGKISEIRAVPKDARILAAMSGDLSPARAVRITFDELRLADGRRIPMRSDVWSGSGSVFRVVFASPKPTRKKRKARDAVSQQIEAARQELRSELRAAKAEIEAPGKLHRLERFGMAQLPYRPQYIDAGTTFTAEVESPLVFGEENASVGYAGTTAVGPAELHAELLTPLGSATSERGERVEAVITRPLFSDSHRLLIPEGSRLQGRVVQVRRARRLARGGSLRVAFHTIVLPDGRKRNVAASLDAIEVARNQHLTLDSEGGARAIIPKSRYLTAAFSVARGEANIDNDDRALRGALGFKVIGGLVGTLAHSRDINRGLAIYGAGMSVYANFIARGREVVYPKGMEMVVGIGKN